MKAWLTEACEVAIGALLWAASYAWGAVLGSMLILAPLLMANVAAGIFSWMPATVALSSGVVAAYALGLPPWDAEEPIGLPLVVGGAAASVVVWDLMRNSADAGSLIVAVAIAAIGWPIRRRIRSRSIAGPGGS